jgi:hypothetical protein
MVQNKSSIDAHFRFYFGKTPFYTVDDIGALMATHPSSDDRVSVGAERQREARRQPYISWRPNPAL